MVLQILADPGQRMLNRDADAAEMVGVAHTRKLQQVRGADRTRGQDHLTRRIDPLDPVAARVFDAYRAGAVEPDAVHQRAGHDGEVGPLVGRAQIGAGGTLPAAPATGLLDPADVVARAGGRAVAVVVIFEAELGAALDDLLA